MAQSYVFYAGQDFNSKNLTCKKGDQLPDRWQEPLLVKKLREQYGQGAVEARTRNVQRRQERTPVEAAAEFEQRQQGKRDRSKKD
jgi:hypothetical protein